MLIDCAKCPARNRACDGCMMQVLFDPVTSEYVTDGGSSEIIEAMDVLVATGMISAETAQTAEAGISAGERRVSAEGRSWLQAV